MIPSNTTYLEPKRSIQRAFLTAMAIAAMLLLGLAFTQQARAGSALIFACADGQTANGWSPATAYDNAWRGLGMNAPNMRFAMGCEGNALTVRNDGLVRHNEGANWSFNAPANTVLRRVHAHRVMARKGPSTIARGAGKWYPHYQYFVNGQMVKDCAEKPNGCSGGGDENAPLEVNGNSVMFHIGCEATGPQPGSFYCQGPVAIRWYGTAVELEDNAAPRIENKNGSLAEGRPAYRGTETLSYTARDDGLGVYRQFLFVDGALKDAHSIGGCNSLNPEAYHFAAPVPCNQVAQGHVAIDTTQYPDGEHQVRVDVEDAAGNRTIAHDARINVDNTPAPSNTNAPALTGEAIEEGRLDLSPGGWANSSSLSFIWKRCDQHAANCVPFTPTDAAARQHTLSMSDVGHRIVVEVTSTGPTGKRGSVTTAPTEVVREIPPPRNVASPALIGPTVEEQQLRLDEGQWEGATSVTFIWKRCDAAGANCVTIANLDQARDYVLTARDVDHRLRVEATATGRAGKRTVVTSPLTDLVKAKARTFANLVPDHPPAASGAQSGSASTSSPFTTPIGITTPGHSPTKLAFSSVHNGLIRGKFGKATVIRGRLLDEHKRPIVGSELRVTATAKGGRALKATVVKTDANGVFSYKSTGPTRKVIFSHGGSAIAVEVAVEGRVSFKAPKRLRVGRPIVFQGKVMGGFVPRAGVPVVIETHVCKKGKCGWRTVKPGRTNRYGAYKIKWPKFTHASKKTYRFRARVLGDSAWAYEPAVSRPSVARLAR